MTVVVTNAVGGTAKPVGLLYIEPERQVPDAGAGTALEATGLDAALTADLLSACLAHERGGVHLYRSVAGRTTIDELRQGYEAFGAEPLAHVRILAELVVAAGGDPHYVSPSARATEKAGAGLLESTWCLAGSVDAMTAELAMLEAVLLAEEKDRGNWELLDLLAAQMAAGDVRTQLEAAVATVLAQEEEHHGWAAQARTRMLFMGVTGGVEPPIPGEEVRGAASADLSSQTKDELYATAQELDIPGRSQMTKDELIRAVAEQTGEAQ
jgi:rubrerythrin